MADSMSEPRAKRSRVDKTNRFEKLRQLKGKKNKYEVEEQVDNVYELVDEREYVKKAREKYGGDWIEEDGTGYAEDGRDFFEDEEDNYSEDDEAHTSNKKQQQQQKGGKKRPRDDDKPSKGKGSIRNLFSNAVPKKATAVSLAEDNILADILGELHEDKPAGTAIAAKPAVVRVIAPAKIVASTKRADAAAAKNYMNSFMNNCQLNEKPAAPVIKKSENHTINEQALQLKAVADSKEPAAESLKKIVESPKKVVDQPKKSTEQATQPMGSASAEAEIDAEMDFSCLNSDENQFETELPKASTVIVAPVAATANKQPTTVESVEVDLQQLLSNWESICQTDDFQEEIASAAAAVDGKSDSNAETAETLKFWFWDAWEDAQKRPGQVFLFGRTADGKSIAVRVENIERVLYLLPREYLLDPITKEPTKQKVTLADLYKEFDEEIATQLKLDGFRSRKVTKSFAHHGIGLDVPETCDYMEVRYDGRKPEPNVKHKYNAIAHIFGSNNGALERLLLERKIKGPCWLNISNYTVSNAPLSWCKLDIAVATPKSVCLANETRPTAAPPLTLLTLNVRTALNPKTLKNEICMIGMLVHSRYHIDRPAPQPPFNRHLCGLSRPSAKPWPFDLAAQLAQYKSTRVHKHDTERALLSWFLAQYQQIDADLIVTHDALDCQLDVIVDRISSLKIAQWSRLGRLRLVQPLGKRLLDFLPGRMLCDVKRSAEECLHARSYDLQSLCQQVLKVGSAQRMEVNAETLLDMYETGAGVLQLVGLTMQDAAYMLRLMYELNILPLALQITNICGNTMMRTLQGGRSERNEYLLLHAFSERNYIVPDKRRRDWTTDGDTTTAATRKKAAYAGGLVLEPVRGLYDKYVLLLDFNSLYPSIIQEYNICFTTVPQPYTLDEVPPLPAPSTEAGILPQQLRRLVESRREVKKLLAQPDLSAELQLQYHIRQMALKLTANSMYGCLGFAQSRFYAQHLAALVTQKGREILMNTQSVVQRLNYEVVYGDTDSIMVNTHSTDFEQVYKIGHAIKQAVNKLYKQLELDIDGVFSVLLLLKKKKYAAVKVSKAAGGELKRTQEHKGLEIVRRDWSQLAIMVGRVVLDEILSEQKQLDEKLDAIHAHLERVRDQLRDGAVPMPMFVITKQLSKAPGDFSAAAVQSHVQVALRMNSTHQRRYKKGDMVDYVICTDGTSQAAVQRAYHLDELKGNEKLQLDTHYYLAHQIHPVVTRMLEVLDGTDASRIAECLGLDPSKFRAAAQRVQQDRADDVTAGEAVLKTTLQKYRQCEKFTFVCVACKTANIVASAYRPATGAPGGYEPVLQRCSNTDCQTAPYQYVRAIHNQLVLRLRGYVLRFYQNWLVCDDPACNYNTRCQTHVLNAQLRPVCVNCKNGALLRQYTERDLYQQLCYLQYMFDLTQQQKKMTLSAEVEAAYQALRLTVEQQLERSAYSTISMAKLFAHLKPAPQAGTTALQSAVAKPLAAGTQVAATLADE